ncbi:LytR C-terminal domain-containing protein [Microbacterium sp. NPDC091313]
MARTTYPRDRFDDLAHESGRVGAHRAENPRMRVGVVLLWAAAAAVVLTVAGIFSALVLSDRISLGPAEAVPTPSAIAEVEPVKDTSYPVLVLNATPQDGLATQVRDTIIGAGWPADSVNAGGAGSTDFETTTVFYVDEADEAAARGLADVIGGAEVAQSSQYIAPDDSGDSKQLTVVLGLDQLAAPESSPSP